MKQSNLPAALRYDDHLLRELTVMAPDGTAWTVATCPPGLFRHLVRETVRPLTDAGYCLRTVRDYDFAYIADRCHCIRWLVVGGRCKLDWLPRLAETS